MTESVVAVEGLSIRYGRRLILDGVSLSVERGAVFALLGRNGTGKTSLVRCLLGQQKPSAGAIRLFGEDVWRKRQRLMTRVGVLPEDPDAPPDMTARELLAFCRRLYPRWDDAGSMARLARVGVPTDVAFGSLSKGQKGAVMLALCLGHTPDLVVLDDPTLGLDVVARRLLYEEIIADLADRGTTVVLTTHDLAGVERLASRVAILKGGRVAVDDSLESLKDRVRRLRCRAPGPASWSPFHVLSNRTREWGAEAVVSNFDEAAFERFRAEAGLSDVEVGPLPLEEIFVAVAGVEGGVS